jgi:putative ABC transport system permease protein
MTMETYREQRGLPYVERAAREVRHAFGRLGRSPGFTAATVFSLALAIGASASVFAVVERVVLNPLPYPDSRRLLMLDFSMPARQIPAGFNSMTAREYFYFAQHARTFDSVAVYRPADQTLGGDVSERIRVARTTPSLATVLRATPAVGSWLPGVQAQGAAPPTAVLSHGLWTRRYGRDPVIVGRTVMLNGVATTIVGVMPPSFAFPDPAVQAWINESFSQADEDSYMWTGVVRLNPAASIESARAEVNQLTQSLHAAAPGNGYDGLLSTALALQDFAVAQIASALWILLAAAVVVLLVACANITNLFLVRSEARHREIAVRRALGAGRAGIAGYFFAESAVLSLAGGALGLGISWAGVRLLVASGPANLPRLDEIQLAPVHALFVVGVSALSSLVFGIVPLLRQRSSGGSLHASNRTTAAAGSHRARQLLMGAQVALALALLVTSGLLLRSFVKLRALDLGFDPSSRLTFQIGLPGSDYGDRGRIVRAHQAILGRVSTLPGVRSASAVTCVPLSNRGFCNGAPLFIEGESPRPVTARPIVASRPVAASFFETMGMSLVLGRGITQVDIDTNSPVTVINETLMRIAFGSADPLGRRIRVGAHQLNGAPLWFTVVGVVKTTPTFTLAEPRPAPKMYFPMFATADVYPRVDIMTYVLRTSTPPLGLAAAARAAVREIDSHLAVSDMRTMQSFIDAAAAPRVFTMVLILIAASTALLLGVIGIYGVVSYVVSQRTNEIGVRLALGAEPSAVTRMILRQCGAVALGGSAAGLIAALLGGRLIGSLLYGVSPRDPAVLATTTLTLLAIALAACWLPARRAASVDPLIALRAE